jgi:hypothetical protein
MAVESHRGWYRASRGANPHGDGSGSQFHSEGVPQAGRKESGGRTLAASPEFRPVPCESAAAAVRARHALGVPFILSVGDIQPRKNYIGLIRAFARMVRAYPQLKQHLVLVGKPTRFSPKVQAAARESGVAERI